MDSASKPPVIMLLYGEGGVGKTSFASTAPNPILADCEGGTKYFGLRGINMAVAEITKWADMKEFLEALKDYDTAIIDPIGELMDKLKRHMTGLNDRKLVQSDGSPSMAGWGWLKQTMRSYIKVLRDSGKHVILIAHVAEDKDEERTLKRPQIETKISQELVNMVDVVGYMTVVKGEDNVEKRIIIVDPSSDKYVAKDRTGQLGKIIEPDFSKIIKACQGTETFSWSNPVAAKPAESKPVASNAKSATKTPVQPKSEPTAQAVEEPQEGMITDEDLDEIAADMGGEVVKPQTTADKLKQARSKKK